MSQNRRCVKVALPLPCAPLGVGAVISTYQHAVDLEEVQVTLCKSAQKKIQESRMREMALLHREREKEKPLRLPAVSVDPGDAGEGKLWPLKPVLPVLQHRAGAGIRSAAPLHDAVQQLPGLPTRQAKKMGPLVSPELDSDDDLEDSNGRDQIILSKSVQKKIQESRMRAEELRRLQREKEKPLRLPALSVDPGDAGEGSFSLSPASETPCASVSMKHPVRESTGPALKKRRSRPSLLSTPVSSQGGSLLHNISANSRPAIAVDFVEWGEKTESGDILEARPFSHPHQELLNAVKWLSSSDWEQKLRGLFNVGCLAAYDSDVLLPRLHAVSLAVTKEVNNLRSRVSRFAISTLGKLCSTLKEDMNPQVDEITQVLLQKTGDSCDFIQKAANRCLGIMVESVTPARAMTALMAGGIQHRNALVRKCAAEHLLTVVEQIGAKKLLSGKCGSTNLLVETLLKLAQDACPDTRCYGRKMLQVLMSHRDFDRYLKKAVPSHDLQSVMRRIKRSETEDPKCEPPSATDPRKSRKSSHSNGGI